MVRHYSSAETIFVYVTTLALLTLSADGQTVAGPPANPFLDPKHDPYNPLRYIASNTLTAIAFALVMLIALVQTVFTLRYGTKWMLPMVIGGYTYAAGFGCRFGWHYHPDSEGIYITEYMFLVLSPCAFIAANYILLKRLAKHISCPTHVLLPVQELTLIFVSSDVTTFLIQAIGGGMFVSHNQSQVQRSPHVFLAGLVLQLVSFVSFTGIYIRFLYRVYTLERDIWERDNTEPWYRDWRALATALIISCIGILVRSGYRVAELSEGFQGYLSLTESYFYGLDTLPLIIATAIYIPFWPGRFIKGGKHIDEPRCDSSECGPS